MSDRNCGCCKFLRTAEDTSAHRATLTNCLGSLCPLQRLGGLVWWRKRNNGWTLAHRRARNRCLLNNCPLTRIKYCRHASGAWILSRAGAGKPCAVILSPRLVKYPVMGPTGYGHIQEIGDHLSTVLCCSMRSIRQLASRPELWTTGGNPVRVYVAGKPGKTVLLKSECDVCARDPVCRRGMARCCLCVRGGPRGCTEDHILPAGLLVNCRHAL